ncbi:MAG: LysM peptidoglycan-binding domain-containing protein [Chloroflexi bacterium]|nr:LysM peptidoglycan-binding domain-containing protein [Chloroflexota bacterium]
MGLAPPTRAHAQGQCTHVVQPGQNLFRISLSYGTNVATLAAMNGIADPSRIYAGQVLVVPCAGAAPAASYPQQPTYSYPSYSYSYPSYSYPSYTGYSTMPYGSSYPSYTYPYGYPPYGYPQAAPAPSYAYNPTYTYSGRCAGMPINGYPYDMGSCLWEEQAGYQVAETAPCVPNLTRQVGSRWQKCSVTGRHWLWLELDYIAPPDPPVYTSWVGGPVMYYAGQQISANCVVVPAIPEVTGGVLTGSDSDSLAAQLIGTYGCTGGVQVYWPIHGDGTLQLQETIAP